MTVIECCFKEDGVWFELQLSGSGQVLLAKSRSCSTQDSEILTSPVTIIFLRLDVPFYYDTNIILKNLNATKYIWFDAICLDL